MKKIFVRQIMGLMLVALIIPMAMAQTEKASVSPAISTIQIQSPPTIAQLIDAGRYGGKVDKRFTEKNFPPSERKEGDYDLELISFGKFIGSSEEALSEVAAKGLEPADLMDLLQYGIKNPEEQRNGLIVALGSIWRVRENDAIYMSCLGENVCEAQRLSVSVGFNLVPYLLGEPMDEKSEKDFEHFYKKLGFSKFSYGRWLGIGIEDTYGDRCRFLVRHYR